jgi:hypothetical protein
MNARRSRPPRRDSATSRGNSPSTSRTSSTTRASERSKAEVRRRAGSTTSSPSFACVSTTCRACSSHGFGGATARRRSSGSQSASSPRSSSSRRSRGGPSGSCCSLPSLCSPSSFGCATACSRIQRRLRLTAGGRCYPRRAWRGVRAAEGTRLEIAYLPKGGSRVRIPPSPSLAFLTGAGFAGASRR